MTILTWTKDDSKKGETIHLAEGPNGLSYVIARKSGRSHLYAVTDVSDRSSAKRLATGTVEGMKAVALGDAVARRRAGCADLAALADSEPPPTCADHYTPDRDIMVQPSQITQLDNHTPTVPNAADATTATPTVEANPEPAHDHPNAAEAILDGLDGVPDQTQENTPMSRLTDGTVQSITMPSFAQKTKAPVKPAVARAKARKVAAKKAVKAQPTANGEPIPADKVTVIEPLPTSGLTPKERAKGLQVIADPDPSVAAAPDGIDPEDVFSWAEALRDDYEEDGKLLTTRGLIKIAKAVLSAENANHVFGILRSIYHTEYETERKAGQGKPPGNEPPRRGRKPSGTARPKPVMVDVKIKPNNFDIPVEARKSSGGRVFATVFGIKARAVIRWMGADGWSREDAVDALQKLGLWKFFKDTVTDHVANNLASGKRGDDGWVGTVPHLTPDQKKALRAVKGKAA